MSEDLHDDKSEAQRPPIPADVKRQVRRQSGFGCIICGLPVYHYDHVIEYATVREHKADNLVLLCPTHHQDKTSGRLPLQKVLKARESPFNAAKVYSARHTLYSVGTTAEIQLGNVLFTYDFGTYTDVEGFSPLAIDGTAVIGIWHEDGEFLLYFYGADPAGKDVFVIEAGELLVSPQVWDYQSTGARFIIRDQPTGARRGRIILDLEKTDLGFKVNRGTVVHNGRGLDIYPDKVVTIPAYVTMSAFTVKDHYIGVAFGHAKGNFLNYP